MIRVVSYYPINIRVCRESKSIIAIGPVETLPNLLDLLLSCYPSITPNPMINIKITIGPVETLPLFLDQRAISFLFKFDHYLQGRSHKVFIWKVEFELRY